MLLLFCSGKASNVLFIVLIFTVDIVVVVVVAVVLYKRKVANSKRNGKKESYQSIFSHHKISKKPCFISANVGTHVCVCVGVAAAAA